jgi:hypothetical protein
MNLAGMQRTEGAQKRLLDGLWCYAAATSETFQTVSEEEFSEVRRLLYSRTMVTGQWA